MSAKRREAFLRRAFTPGRPKRGIVAKARAVKRKRNVAFEMAAKKKVVERDKHCRFPLCGCQRPGADRFKAALTVSHDFHKGMGGESSKEVEKVSIPDLMIALCKWRHQNAPVSRDKKTIRTIYLTPDNDDGPIAWEIDLRALYPHYPQGAGRAEWFEVARETYALDGGLTLEPLTNDQRRVLDDLATMER